MQNLIPPDDLFAVDKRLTLKPVMDFNKYLRDAFGPGVCSCARCKDSNGDESNYSAKHTFTLNGQSAQRRFAKTSGSDVFSSLAKAWLAYTKEDLKPYGFLDLELAKSFVEPSLHDRLQLLIIASGVAIENEGAYELQPLKD